MREWKPGDVALLTLSHKVDGRGHEHQSSPVVGIRDNVDSWACGAAIGRRVEDAHVDDARPLVVIDPEDREQVERFREIASRWADQVPYSDMREAGDMDHLDAMQAALREFANPTPPKPDEPTGLGAVVEDVDGNFWIRTCKPCEDCLDKPWQSGPVRRNWLIVEAVRVLSEGVAP